MVASFERNIFDFHLWGVQKTSSRVRGRDKFSSRVCTNSWANFSEKIHTHWSGKILWGSTLILSQVQDSHLVEVVLSQVSLHFINRVLCKSFQDNFTKKHCKCKLAECSLPQYVLYAITTIYHTYSLFIERRVEQIINLSATSSALLPLATGTQFCP